MRLTFHLHDAQEISSSTSGGFISTFHYKYDSSDFDPDIFRCGEIT